MSDNKRGKARFDLSETVFVYNQLNQKKLGVVANIHDDGFMVIGNEAAVENRVYQLTLSDENAKVRINLGVECLWISDTGTGDQLWMGFQIVDISEVDQRKLDELIGQFSK